MDDRRVLRVEHQTALTVFGAALDAFMTAVGALDDDHLLAASRCTGWTVGDVIVHVHLGLQDMLLGVVAPTRERPDTDAAGYWRIEVPTNDDGADRIAQVRFTRLVGAAYRRPTGIVAHLRPTAEGLATAVGALVPGAVRFQGRILATGDFLATWAVELAIHHLDLARDIPVAGPAPTALRLARATVEALVGAALPDDWSDEVAVLLATGRLPVADDHRARAGAVADLLPVLG